MEYNSEQRRQGERDHPVAALRMINRRILRSAIRSAIRRAIRTESRSAIRSENWSRGGKKRERLRTNGFGVFMSGCGQMRVYMYT